MPSPFFRRVAATTPLKSSDIRLCALKVAQFLSETQSDGTCQSPCVNFFGR